MKNSDKIIKEALLCQPTTGFQVSPLRRSGCGGQADVSKIAGRLVSLDAGRLKSFIVSGFPASSLLAL
jgi:hypothetical protein